MESRYWQGALASDTIGRRHKHHRERHGGHRVIEPLREISGPTAPAFAAYNRRRARAAASRPLFAEQKRAQHILDTMAAMIFRHRPAAGEIGHRLRRIAGRRTRSNRSWETRFADNPPVSLPALGQRHVGARG